MDIERYDEIFHPDLLSIWMKDMGLPQTTALQQEVKKYWKFWRVKFHRQAVNLLPDIPATPAQLRISIMMILTDAKEAKPEYIIQAILSNGLSMTHNRIYGDFVKYDIDKAFWQIVKQGTGYQEKFPTLSRLAIHLLLTAAVHTMRQELLFGLEEFISIPHQTYCYNLVTEWLRCRDILFRMIYEIAIYVETETNLPQRFLQLSVNDLAATEIFPCIHEIILSKLMHDIGNQIIDIKTIQQTVIRRRAYVWYDDVRYFYEGILQVANMQAFYQAHAIGFHTVDPQKVWQEYTSDYYRMDTYYRQFHWNYTQSQKNCHPLLSDLFIWVKDTVENLYTHWFLGKLNGHWSDICADNLRDYGKILEIPEQAGFYRRQVEAVDGKVYVIVSDALRYEVAVSLAERLSQETQSKVSISSMQSIFPTITKFGMAALLPHRRLSVQVRTSKKDRLAVLADRQSTEASRRDKILKAANQKSVALKYRDIIDMNHTDRKELVKGMEIVYLYHDTIDEAGHIGTSIFEACDIAIDELQNLVRIITSEFGGTQILITSDHGFLYTDKPLKEDNKVNKSTESEQDIEIGRRYAIMQKGAQPDYLLPVRFLDGNTKYTAFTPRENIRIKMKGGGMNFVHGGISLQEMVVPVIDYHFLCNSAEEHQRSQEQHDIQPVTVHLLSASHTISNKSFTLRFYQKEVVSSNRTPAMYEIYFTDSSNQRISSISRIIADIINPQDREFCCKFYLKPMRRYEVTKTYYLVIKAADNTQTLREEFRISLPHDEDNI